MTQGRKSLPDFDIDFPSTRADEVIDYVQRRWGHEHVARVGSHMRLQSKGAFKGVQTALASKLPPESYGWVRDDQQADRRGRGHHRRARAVLGRADGPDRRRARAVPGAGPRAVPLRRAVPPPAAHLRHARGRVHHRPGFGFRSRAADAQLRRRRADGHPVRHGRAGVHGQGQVRPAAAAHPGHRAGRHRPDQGRDRPRGQPLRLARRVRRPAGLRGARPSGRTLGIFQIETALGTSTTQASSSRPTVPSSPTSSPSAAPARCARAWTESTCGGASARRPSTCPTRG